MQLLVISPVLGKFFTIPNGNVYQADVNTGVIANIKTLSDLSALVAAGCIQVAPPPGDLLGVLLAANFNITTDQQIPINYAGRYRVRRIVGGNTSVAGMSTAQGGFYTGAGKTGTTIVAAGQVWTGMTNSVTATEATMAAPNTILPGGTPLFFSLSVAQGAPATADLFVYGDAY